MNNDAELLKICDYSHLKLVLEFIMENVKDLHPEQDWTSFDSDASAVNIFQTEIHREANELASLIID